MADITKDTNYVTIRDETTDYEAKVDTTGELNTKPVGVSCGTWAPLNTDELILDERQALQLDGTGQLIGRDCILTDELCVFDDFSGGDISAEWTIVAGTGTSYAVTDSHLTISSGTTANAEIYLYREIDFSPLHLLAIANISQRIANQDLYIEFTDNPDPALETAYLRFHFTGTDNTKVLCETRAHTGTGGTESNEVTILSSATLQQYRMTITSLHATFSAGLNRFSRDILASMIEHIPTAYTSLYLRLRIKNGAVAPASNTNLILDSCRVINYNQIEVTNNSEGQSIPVKIKGFDGTVDRNVRVDTSGNLLVSAISSPTELANAITKYATFEVSGTFPVTILSYTVTSGKTLYISNYHLQVSGSGLAIATLKIDGSTVMTYEAPSDMALMQYIFGEKSPIKATSGQVVTVVADTGSSSNKPYIASFNGVEV